MNINFTKNVRYELMYGYQAKAELDRRGIVYLALGSLELHGSHLPMGLDVIKAHAMCCVLAQRLGGVVFPPHYYSAVHKLPGERSEWLARNWGNIYQEETAKASVVETVGQIRRMGTKVCALYTGHYPQAQLDMVEEIAAETDAPAEGFNVIVCPEKKLSGGGDHAGVNETSLLLYLNRDLVDMSAINEQGYVDHHWTGALDPRLASAARGEELAGIITAYMEEKIGRAMPE